MIQIRVDDFDQFHTVLNDTLLKATKTNARVFVLFFANEVPETGKSWCPDCVKADPMIKETLNKLDNAVLIEAAAGDRPRYRTNPHPYKTDDQIALKAVPTLIEWNQTGPVKRLVEAECLIQGNLDAFIQ
ncbi:hypothetical protein BC833DRAFT_581358 [Globomyces pollinis-pini]|nr:hypothetical protein BC833DRAFT_581358 [Globomyces pollinis-pini]